LGPALDEVGARDGHEALAEQERRIVRRARMREITDRDIHVALREVDHAIVGRDVDVDRGCAARNPGSLGMSHSEANDTVVDTVSAGSRCGACSASAASAISRSFSVTVRWKGAARAGQRERAMPPLEERHAERLFQRLHLARQRGLREEELLRGERERKPAPGGFEAAQEIERRQAAKGLMHACGSCEPC
jgi:hypothetical protein